MTLYFVVLSTHVSCVVASLTLFLIRARWRWTENDILQQKWIKVLPHVVDTILLGSALGLTVLIDQYPFIDNWLTVKFFALVVYIITGSVALSTHSNTHRRALALTAAVATFLFIVGVAWYHHPMGFLLLLGL